MTGQAPFDLFAFVGELVADAPWIEEIRIFGSRRHLTNVSYGSDIDLLVIPNKDGSFQDYLREAVDHPYIDAFLVVEGVATSVANQSRDERPLTPFHLTEKRACAASWETSVAQSSKSGQGSANAMPSHSFRTAQQANEAQRDWYSTGMHAETQPSGAGQLAREFSRP